MSLRLKILLGTAPAVVFLDQLSKALVVFGMAEGQRIPIIPSLFTLVHSRNPGAAFGSFAHLPDSVRLPFFIATSTIALIIILLYLLKLRDERKGVFFSLSLIVGGAIGNVIDRIFRGEVVDFLSLHWYDRWADWTAGPFHWRFRLEWPAFNIADSAISVGVIGLMILLSKKSP